MGLVDFLSNIASAIWNGIKTLWKVCTRIIRAVISFTADIMVGLLVAVALLLGYEPASVQDSPIKPFVADMDKLMAQAPVKEVGIFNQKNKNLMKGLYDTRTGQIHKPTYMAGDSVDSRTRQVLGNEPIVILG